MRDTAPPRVSPGPTRKDDTRLEQTDIGWGYVSLTTGNVLDMYRAISILVRPRIRGQNRCPMAATIESAGAHGPAELRPGRRGRQHRPLRQPLYMLLLPPLFPLLREVYGVGYTELGFAISVFSIVTACTQAPVGFAVDSVRSAAHPGRGAAAGSGRSSR